VDLKAITDLALSLPVDERARLVRQLLESLDSPPPGDVEQLWRQEAVRRAEQIDRGEVTLTPADEVLAKARALLK
jgi:putative addiction module component (TIGR02574 family)